MEEALNEALFAASVTLAEALRLGLAARGFDADFCVCAADGRVAVVSRSEEVWRAEHGGAGAPPGAPLSDVARDVAPGVVAGLRDRIEGALR